MPIIQPGILPAPPVTPRFGDYLGEGFASGVGTGTDLLLQALLSGQLRQQPIPATLQNPGTFNFPLGSQSPGEAAQIRALGGVPTQQGFQVPATYRGVGTQPVYRQPTMNPQQLQQMMNLASLQKSQADVSLIPAEKTLKESQAKLASSQANFFSGMGQGGEGDFITLDESLNPVPPGTPGSTRYIRTKTGLRPTPLTAKEEADRRALIESETERAKTAANIPAAIRSVKVHLDQFQKAFPSGTNSQALQSAIGLSKNIGATFGIGITPEQRAVLKTLPLATIGLVRVSGALGRVTNQELDAAEQALNQAGLTDEERLLVARNLSQQYLARVNSKELSKAMEQYPDISAILTTFGMQVPTETSVDSHLPMALLIRLLQQQFPGVKITKVK